MYIYIYMLTIYMYIYIYVFILFINADCQFKVLLANYNCSNLSKFHTKNHS